MKLTKVFANSGVTTIGFNCCRCKKVVLDDYLPYNWYDDGAEMLCPNCLKYAYGEVKGERDKLRLTMKNMLDSIKTNLREGTWQE